MYVSEKDPGVDGCCVGWIRPAKEGREHQALEANHARGAVRNVVHGHNEVAVLVDLQGTIAGSRGLVQLHDHVQTGPGAWLEVDLAAANGLAVQVVTNHGRVLAEF